MSGRPPYLAAGPEFEDAWLRFARAWSHCARRDPQAAERMVEQLLAGGLSRWAGEVGAGAGRARVGSAAELRCQVAVLQASGLFEVERYLDANPDVAQRDAEPVAHFCSQGWHEMRNPSLGFDLWWYWAEHLDPGSEEVNPFLHYVVEGRQAGLTTLPPERPERPAATLPDHRPIRRICLFAAYAADGVVDDYVVEYVRELSRFADVYFLADCHLADVELDRLAGITKGAWAIRHGAYDFGSYSMLARDLVGWERLDGYDELLLVNDSSYLLRPLDEVFDRMETTPCHWWGLQATAHPYREADDEPDYLTHEEALRRYTPRGMMRTNDHLHVGSYFLAYRADVIRDPGFRHRLETVAEQRTKSGIINKYEIGLTRYLTQAGFGFRTFAEIVPPYHPMYGPSYFLLLSRGMPLLKRQFLVDNPYDTPDLVHWKERVLELVPEAPVEMIERNLRRVASDDRLQRSFAITTGPDGEVRVPELLSDREFAAADKGTPTFDHWWAFPVCAYDHSFAGNDRAVFEAVRHDPSIKKIVLTRSRRIEVDGANVVVVPLASPEGQQLVMRAGQIFVKHAPRINVPYPLDPKRHNFVNLWHGIPLKRFGYATVQPEAARRSLARLHKPCTAVITSSRFDSLAMTAAFHPLGYQHMWPTGLPRNDFVTAPSAQLPADLRAEEERLREQVGGRRLVLFMPTFRDGQGAATYRFDDEEIDWLAAWCERIGAVLGVREHMADRAGFYGPALARTGALDLSSRRYPNVEVLYRVASGLVTDYSSCLVDFLLTGRPVVSFAYDLEHYATQERGLFYELADVVPGPVVLDFAGLRSALDALFDERTPDQVAEYEWKRSLFFDHLDAHNSSRVVHRVKELYR